MLDTAGVAVDLALAMERKEPASLATLCESEAGLLWAGKGFQTWHWLSTMGVTGEAESAAKQLAEAIERLRFIGIAHSGPCARWPQMRPKTEATLRLWDIKLRPDAQIVDRLVVFYLLFDLWLWGLMEKRRVLVVNNHAVEVAKALESGDLSTDLKAYIPGPHEWKPATVTPIVLENGLSGSGKALADINRLYETSCLANWRPDIALIGAGPRAAHLCVEIAERYAIPALDMGQALDRLHSPWDETGDRWKQVHSWYLEEG
ncbi:MAG TPA: hypothetical protein VNA25_30255 [Phycisphaerae bacterium]|nr:hypothetical protein [Phycisphaerae bacterium]